MVLAAEAKRVAAEFDISPDDVRRATKEFIRQMGKFSLCFFVVPCEPRAMLTIARRGGPPEGRHRPEPDPHLRHRSPQWHREGELQWTRDQLRGD